jgi:hypothetical protein
MIMNNFFDDCYAFLRRLSFISPMIIEISSMIMWNFFEYLHLHLHLPFQLAEIARTLGVYPLQAFCFLKHWHGNTVSKSNARRKKFEQRIAIEKAERKRKLKKKVLLLA